MVLSVLFDGKDDTVSAGGNKVCERVLRKEDCAGRLSSLSRQTPVTVASNLKELPTKIVQR